MVRKSVAICCAIFLAFIVLSVSILRASAINYSFLPSPVQTLAASEADVNIDYTLPYPGRVLPDHPLWAVKALRDRLWLLVSVNPSRKAELYLLFADKRLASSKILFEKGKPDLAFSALTKAEKYLELARLKDEENRKAGMDTRQFLTRLANSALKHREVLNEILEIAPEDAKPEIIKIESYSRDVYKDTRDTLNSLGMPIPNNPFNGD